MEVILAEPRGFCAGVHRAIEIVERAIIKYGPPVYVRHEIVHNQFVVENLKTKGAIFVDSLDEIPDDALTIFSAHGVSDAVEAKARIRGLPVIDATCPLVTKVHKEAKRNEALGKTIILIGHAGHPEVEGTSGRVKQEVYLVETTQDVEKLPHHLTNLSYVTQTTLSVDDTFIIIQALKEKYPTIEGPDVKNICYATQNRQNAVKSLADEVEAILVIGAQNSSNSNRLRDLASEYNIPAYLIHDETDIQLSWLENVEKLGITAGASAPEILIQQVIDYLDSIKDIKLRSLKVTDENVQFKLPKLVMDTVEQK